MLVRDDIGAVNKVHIYEIIGWLVANKRSPEHCKLFDLLKCFDSETGELLDRFPSHKTSEPQ